MKSMTGFGRGEVETDGFHIAVEIKTVNHRYFEPNVRYPRALSALEPAVRAKAKEKIVRGKTDIQISYINLNGRSEIVVVNETLLHNYVEAIREAAERESLLYDLKASDVLNLPDVLTTQDVPEDADSLWPLLEQALDAALEGLNEMREREGANLAADLSEKVRHLEAITTELEAEAPQVVIHYRERLHERMKELLEKGSLDEDRLEAEVAVYADKCAIDEELTRLHSHCRQFLQILEAEGPVGRQLDFLTQELNREANTIASKANALPVSRKALAMKNEIEKIREQVQNIE